MNYKETMKWFEEFYNKNEKLVNILIKKDKNKMIKYKIPDVWAMIGGEYKEIDGYRIKGYTKFDWHNLCICGETLEIDKFYGIPQVVRCYSNYNPEITIIGKKQYLTESSLDRLQQVFTRLLINLEYYKKMEEIWK